MIELIKQKEKQYPRLFEIIRFVIMGAVATLVDMLVMAVVMYLPCRQAFGSFFRVFTSKEIAPVWLSVVGTSAGFLVSVVVNYILSLWFVYEGENKQAKTKKGIILFVVLSAIGLGIQSLGMFLGCTLLKLNEFVIKIVLILVVLVFNYITRKIFIFNKKGEQANASATQQAEQKNSAGQINLAEQKAIKEEQTEQKIETANGKQIVVVNASENVHAKGKMNKFELIANEVTIFSGFGLFWALTSGITNSTLNLVLKLGCCAVWFVVMLLFVFLFNPSFCLNSFKSLAGKSKKEICTSVIAILQTIMFVGYTIFKMNKLALNIVGVLLAAPILLVAFVRVWQFVVERATKFVKSLTKTEILFFAIGFVIATILIVVADVQTGMLIGKNYEGDFRWYEIYSFDTNLCFNRDIFNNPFSAANNYKHLMLSFVVLPFSLPFAVLFNILNMPIGYAVFVQFLQVVLLLVSIIVLKRLLNLEKLTEIAFYIAIFFAASCLFNVLIYEKFVVGFFFAVLTINAAVKNDNAKYFYYILASFSLTLNLALLPLVVLKKGKPFKNVVKECITLSAIFVGVACLFGQLNNAVNIIINGVKNAAGDYVNRVNGNFGFADTVVKFFAMFTQFWVLPTITSEFPNIWATIPQAKSFYFVVGILLFAIAILGFVLNRKNKFVQHCFYWFCVVFVLALVVGWGAGANEMFIYSLAYVWAIIPLVFVGLKSLMKNKYLLLTAVCLIAVLICIQNIQILHSILTVAHGWFKV